MLMLTTSILHLRHWTGSLLISKVGKKNVADIKPGQSTGYYIAGIVLYTEVGECGPGGYYPSRIYIADEDRSISEVSVLAR